jgi:hypothetical protein
MVKTSNYSKNSSKSFILNDESIRKICLFFGENTEKIEIVAECSDDIKRKFQGTEDFLAYENPNSAKILKLKLISISKDYDQRIEVNFSGVYSNISVNVDAEEVEIVGIKTRLNQILEGCIPWYAFFSKINYILLASIFFLTIFVIAIANNQYEFLDLSQANEPPKSFSENIIYLGTNIFFLFLIAGLLQFFKSKVFPIAFYAIGQQANRYSYLEALRWLFIGSVLTPIILKLL